MNEEVFKTVPITIYVVIWGVYNVEIITKHGAISGWPEGSAFIPDKPLRFHKGIPLGEHYYKGSWFTTYEEAKLEAERLVQVAIEGLIKEVSVQVNCLHYLNNKEF